MVHFITQVGLSINLHPFLLYKMLVGSNFDGDREGKSQSDPVFHMLIPHVDSTCIFNGF
jgi:hypothetical protein